MLATEWLWRRVTFPGHHRYPCGFRVEVTKGMSSGYRTRECRPHGPCSRTPTGLSWLSGPTPRLAGLFRHAGPLAGKSIPACKALPALSTADDSCGPHCRVVAAQLTHCQCRDCHDGSHLGDSARLTCRPSAARSIASWRLCRSVVSRALAATGCDRESLDHGSCAPRCYPSRPVHRAASGKVSARGGGRPPRRRIARPGRHCVSQAAQLQELRLFAGTATIQDKNSLENRS